MELEVWVATRPSLTHIENEDRAVVHGEVFDDVNGVEHRRVPVPGLLAAVDGLGGHRAGHVASHLAAEVLADAEVPRDERAAADLLEVADRRLSDAMRANPELDGMGATVALTIVLDEGSLVTANAGDSTVWRYADGRLESLTVSDRIGGSRIAQCLGANTGLEPHVQRSPLRAGELLLLASDGLTDVVPAETIAAVLGGPTEQALQQLLEYVERARYPDDVTIVLAEVHDSVG